MASRWSDAGFGAIARLVREQAGLLFTSNRQPQAESSMRRAMRRAGVHDSLAYAALLRSDEAALDDLLAELTVGETYFFREPGQFAYLRQSLPRWLQSRYGRDYVPRTWSAGCATGEEAYSLAITLADAGIAARVIGTDISRARLAFARRARYRAWSLRGVPPEVVRLHFTREGDEFVLAPSLRDAVEFRYLNLARDVYPAISSGIWGMDVILCRNVLIYMDDETIARVSRRLLDSLAEDGILLLGASDPLLTKYISCDVVQTGAGVAYRRPARRPRAQETERPAAPEAAEAAGAAEAGRAAAPAGPTWQRPRRDRAATAEAAPTPPAGAPEEDRIASAYAAHDYGRVVTLARQRLTAGPDERAATALVRALANLGRLEEAGRACASALDVHRTSIELLYLHAVLVAQAGRIAESADAARRVLYLDRRFVVGHLALGGALARLGDREGALRAFAAAERLLAGMPPDAIVPASDGEPAGRLLEMARLQRRLLGRSAA